MKLYSSKKDQTMYHKITIEIQTKARAFDLAASLETGRILVKLGRQVHRQCSIPILDADPILDFDGAVCGSIKVQHIEEPRKRHPANPSKKLLAANEKAHKLHQEIKVLKLEIRRKLKLIDALTE